MKKRLITLCSEVPLRVGVHPQRGTGAKLITRIVPIVVIDGCRERDAQGPNTERGELVEHVSNTDPLSLEFHPTHSSGAMKTVRKI